MNAYGQWVIGLAVAYTALLIATGRIARRKAQAGAGGYFVGGRQFSPLLVACCVTGLFSGSTFIAVLELSYLKGISAAWYGVAETIQVVLIALFLVTPFRERALVTISGLIGDHYGRAASAAGRVAPGHSSAVITGAKVAELRAVQARMFHHADCSERSTPKTTISTVRSTSAQRV